MSANDWVPVAVAGVSALGGGGIAGALTKYRLGTMRISQVEVRKAEADAFAIAMQAQQQLNDRMSRHIDAVQGVVEELQRRVDSLEHALSERDATIILLTNERDAALAKANALMPRAPVTEAT